MKFVKTVLKGSIPVWVFILFLIIGGIIGCDNDTTTEYITTKTDADWEYKYEDQFNSYIEAAWNQTYRVRSHANLEALLNTTNNTNNPGCYSCKSSYSMNALYDKYGDELWNMTYNQVRTKIGKFWSCSDCHKGDPGNKNVGAQGVIYPIMARDFFKKLAPADAACGQCHNILGGMTRRIVQLPQNVAGGLKSLDAYKYGTGPQAIADIMYEFGDRLDSGGSGQTGVIRNVRHFTAGHPDIEFYYLSADGVVATAAAGTGGSSHKNAGLRCVDCHMQMKTNAGGKEFRSHNASGPIVLATSFTTDAGAPIAGNLQVNLDKCLECHTTNSVGSSARVTDRASMLTFFIGKKNDIKTLSETVRAKFYALASLIGYDPADPNQPDLANGVIGSGSARAPAPQLAPIGGPLDLEAREVFSMAVWYREYAESHRKSASATNWYSGGKAAAMNYYLSMKVLGQANASLDAFAAKAGITLP